VVEKLGFREEGLRPRYLHIDGAWRDHLIYALTAEEVPDGLLRRWRRARQDSPQTSQTPPTPQTSHTPRSSGEMQ
ncbi:GNAT family N-acetyltransferase, partial [Streptomyces exfoliatus]